MEYVSMPAGTRRVLSRPTLDRLAGQMRLACEEKSPAVAQLVAAATERIPKEMSHA